MEKPRQGFFSSDVGVLVLLALARLIFHALTNGQYGFHRDELATLDDARYLAWGYVAYPPVTPFIARVALTLFGPSITGLRLFSASAMCAAMVLAGLTARELGGSRRAQLLTALAVTIAPAPLVQAYLFQYVSFDFLWWVLIAYFLVRLLKSGNPRWWLGVGAAIGLGMMTKYTMGFLVIGLVGAVLVTNARRYLLSPWLWAGVAISLVIFLPNFLWQLNHHFVSLEFLRTIHERDVRIGRTGGFLPEQFFGCMHVLTIPLWILGLGYCFFTQEGKRYRFLGWMYVFTMGIFLLAKGRAYYAAPLYPMLFAAGSVRWERWIGSLSEKRRRIARRVTWRALAVGGVISGLLVVPLAPVRSRLWNITNKVNGDFREEIGWPELVDTVAGVYRSVPADEKPKTGILAGNYGEAGAINLYGPAQGLPMAISGINSYWARGYGNPAPETLIVVGFSQNFLKNNFGRCDLAAHNTNRYGVENEESKDHPDIYLCHDLRQTWPEFWKDFQYFG